VSGRDFWWSYVVADLRTKLSLALWIVVLCMAAWGFTTGHVLPGLFVVAVGVFYSAHPFAALGAWLGARERRRKT
jgi:formate/nitrite transporter FocA (FNT family)